MGRVAIEQERCKGCELCVVFCPRHLLRLSRGINPLGYHPAESMDSAAAPGKGCTGCAVCGLVCPEVAISVYR